MESILTSIKKLLGIIDEIHFDDEIIMYINSAIMSLTQIGIGPSVGYKIQGTNESWVDFVGARIDIESVKTYIYLKVKLIFDPPLSATVMNAFDQQLKQIEWRLNTQIEEYIPEVVIINEDG